MRHARNETFWYSLQEETETFRNFLIRTDHLAQKLGVNVQDLPDLIGIGRASLFCYRTGTRPITVKSWLKLAAAEEAAGISGRNESPVAAPKDPPVYGLEERMDRIEAALERLTTAVEALSCAQKPLPTSSSVPGHDSRKKSA